jgi:chaperonin GroES
MSEGTSVAFKPFGARVAIKMDDAIGVTSGGIILAEKAKKPPAEGVIVAMGDGDADWHPLPFYVGQRVVISPYGGHAYKHDGHDYIIMAATDILATLPDAEAPE